MPNFIVSPYAISFNSIKSALESYINKKGVSEVLDTWKDFYTAGAGQTVLELDAAIGAFYAFHFIVGRREAYLPLAQNYSSILGAGQGLGYNSSRGNNLHIGLLINPITTQALTRWSVLGSYGEYDLILWGEVIRDSKGNIINIKDRVIFNTGEQKEVCCILGNSQTQGINITTKELRQFVFTASDTTDDCRLILTDKEVPFASELKQAINDKYIMLSNSYGSVDVFYLNNGNYNYKVGDTLYLQYIQRNNIKYNQVTTDNIIFDYGSIIETNVIKENEEKEAGENIKLHASIYHETNNVVRARKDYGKLLLNEKAFNLADVNDLDINPGLMALTYLTKDKTLLTDYQKQQYFEDLEKACPDGVAEAFIVDSIPVARKLKITLWQEPNEIIPGNINTQIQNILDTYNQKLEATLDFEKLEKEIESIQGVQIARIDIDTKEHFTNQGYKPYDIIEVKNVLNGNTLENQLFLASNVEAKSGMEQPNWSSAPEFNDELIDNNLVWKNSNDYIDSVPSNWRMYSTFNIYDNVKVGYTIEANSTTEIFPVWGTNIVVDGNVTFNKLHQYDSPLSVWEPEKRILPTDLDTYYKLGDNTRIGVLKVKELLNYSSKEEPDWTTAVEEDDEIFDNALTWKLFYKSFVNKNYGSGDNFGKIIDNKLNIYRCISPVTPDTLYWNESGEYKKYDEKDPFNGEDQIFEVNYITTSHMTPTGEEDEGGNPIYTTTYTQEAVKGALVWEKEEVIEDLIDWKPYSAVEVDKYINKNNNFFKCVDNEKYTTDLSIDTECLTNPLISEITDNTVVWEVDKIRIGNIDKNVIGTTWFPSTEYDLDTLVIIPDVEGDYIYNVVYTNDRQVTINGKVFEVINLCGNSGYEPEWTYQTIEAGENVTKYHETVQDNNILWTKVDNESYELYQENTTYKLGKIIKIDDGVYYMFTSLIGKTGLITPDWSNLRSGSVMDGNIQWVKLAKEAIKITLNWNEYFQLTHEIVGIN